MKSAFLIAATSSGSGKTTLSLGIMRALVRKKLSVQPFKCGPDYIDTQFQTIASEKEAINLDLFMSSEKHLRFLFNDYSKKSDVSIIEGLMGMYDGYDNMKGSSADIAIKLDLPVILLVNAASTSYSVAATIFGFSNFCPEIRIAGVIFNRVSSESHFSYLCKACKDVGLECFGYIEKNEALSIPSRHLGLTLSSREEMNKFIDIAADEVEKNVEIDRLLKATYLKERPKEDISSHLFQDITVAVARDEAFSFIYPVNLKTFRKVKYFSPIYDSHIPDADLLYLPGGYPELYSERLSGNFTMRNEIKAFAEKGGKILAECGGLIYLSEDIDGKKMCGVFKLKATMKNSKLSLGYRTIKFPNLTMRGHEFHYSHIINPTCEANIASQENIKGNIINTPIYRYKNTIAGYTHLYWAETDILKLWK